MLLSLNKIQEKMVRISAELSLETVRVIDLIGFTLSNIGFDLIKTILKLTKRDRRFPRS